MKLIKLGSFGLATVMAAGLFAGNALAQDDGHVYVPRQIEGSSSSSSSNSGSVLFVSSGSSYNGGLWVGAGVGYSTMLWDHKKFKPIQQDPQLKHNSSSKHSFDNAVVTFSAGYNWQYIGLATDIDFLGGYGGGDFAADSKKEDGATEENYVENEWQFRDTMIRWHAGPTFHYMTDKFMAELGAGIGLTWVKIKKDTKTTNKTGEKTTVDGGINTWYDDTQFSFKLNLKFDYFITTNIGVGLNVGYTFVDLADDYYLETQDAEHAHLIDVQANLVYRF